MVDFAPLAEMVVVPCGVVIITCPLVVCSTVVPIVVGAGVENSPIGVVVVVDPSAAIVVVISPCLVVVVNVVSPVNVVVGAGVDVDVGIMTVVDAPADVLTDTVVFSVVVVVFNDAAEALDGAGVAGCCGVLAGVVIVAIG